MTVLSKAEIHATAVKAGFTHAQATVMTAIAMAESGGNTKAHNPVPPDNSYGLWQINMIGRLGPARRRELGLSSDADLYDPLTNARAAYVISGRGKNFRPWSTYLHGTYRKFLRGSDATGGTAAGDGEPSPGGDGSAGGGGGSAGAESAGLLSGATSGLLSGAENIVYKAGFLLLGVALIGFGVVKLAGPTAVKSAMGPAGAVL